MATRFYGRKYALTKEYLSTYYKCETQLSKYWIGDFKSFDKKKQECQTHLLNCWSCFKSIQPFRRVHLTNKEVCQVLNKYVKGEKDNL